MNIPKERKEEFKKIYKESILPNVKIFERKRLREQKIFKIVSLLFLIPIYTSITILLFIFIYYLFFHNYLYLEKDFNFNPITFKLGCISVYLLIILPIPYLLCRRKIENNFKKLIKKEKILEKVIKPFEGIKWFQNDITKANTGAEKLTTEELISSGLFIYYERRYTDDEFEGRYKCTNFIISETKMTNFTYRPRNYFYKETPIIYEYEGIIVNFKLNNIVKNRTIVATNKDFTAKNNIMHDFLFSIIYIIPILFLIILALLDPSIIMKTANAYICFLLSSICFIAIFIIKFNTYKKIEKENGSLNKVVLEDPKFGKRFNVYSSDQIEARFLVTPGFMEKLYNLQTAFGSKNLKCSFYKDKLMISIETKKDLFEICSLNKPTKEVIYEFFYELDSIYEMIDYFKLYENIYLTK